MGAGDDSRSAGGRCVDPGLSEGLESTQLADEAPFASGETGIVVGPRLTAKAIAADLLLDAAALARLEGPRLARAAAVAPPRRRVLVVGVERADRPNLMAQARAELERSRHDVTVATCDVGGRGKFENLNALIDQAGGAGGFDWLLAIDDDVELPRGFLDRFLFLAERFGLRLAQPAHRRRSHAAWRVTRRRAATVVRETGFVEIGPISAFHADTFATLLPFPDLRAGWGLDAHWAALARERNWPIGVIDATPIRHALRPIADDYRHADATAESRAFLAGRPHVTAAEAQRTLVAHRRW